MFQYRKKRKTRYLQGLLGRIMQTKVWMRRQIKWARVHHMVWLKKSCGTVTGLLFAAMLTGCSFLGKTEVYHNSPQMAVVKNEDDEKNQLAIVQRGDLTEEKTAMAKGNSTETSLLKFKVSGEHFEEICVGVGERVKKGQVLARLDTKQYRENRQECEFQLQRAQIEQDHQKALFDQYAMSLSEYQRKVDDLEHEINYYRQKLAECDAYIAERTIVADIDGVVKQMEEVDKNGLSDESKTIFVLVGGDTTFLASVEKPDGFEVNGRYEMELGAHVYQMILTDISKADNGWYDVSFSFANDDYDPADTGMGKIRYIANEMKDVMYVPVQAVAKVRDTYYVYYPEGERRQAKEVKVGPVINGNYVIYEGVTEGEELICD